MERKTTLDNLFEPIRKRKLYEEVVVKNNFQTGGATTRSETKRLKQSLATLKESQSETPPVALNEDAKEAAAEDVDKDGNNDPAVDPGRNDDPHIQEQVLDDNEPGAEPAAPLQPVNEDFKQDTIVVSNDDLEAHILQTFHRHQKIFQ